MWQVYLNYTLTDLPTIPATPEYYSSNLLYLSSLVEALSISKDQLLLTEAQNLALNLSSIWQSGDRLIRQPFSPLEVYPYDPAIDYSQIIQDIQNGVTIWKIDLRLASLMNRLAIYSKSKASLIEEFHEKTNFALNQVVQGGYLSIFEVGILPTEGFVDRMESTALISEWLAMRRLQKSGSL